MKNMEKANTQKNEYTSQGLKYDIAISPEC